MTKCSSLLLAHTCPRETAWMHLHSASNDSSRENMPLTPDLKASTTTLPWIESSNMMTLVRGNEERISRATLKPAGVLFSSNPHGENEEGWNGGRYGAYHDLAAWRRYLSLAGFTELEHYYRPTGLPREQQPWLASVWRKSSI